MTQKIIKLPRLMNIFSILGMMVCILSSIAVEDQYPSNALFLSRNGEEKDDYQLQHLPGSFFDQSHVLFDNRAISNGRKRRREEIAAPINSFPMNHSPPHQFIELPLLHSQPFNGVSAGLRLSLDDQQELEFSHASSLLYLISEKFSSLIEYQREEIEHFLYSKIEELLRTLNFRRRKHCRALLTVAMETVARTQTEVAAEVEKAARRNAEYKARAAQLGIETQLWRERAKSQESIAAALQAQLLKAMTETESARAGAQYRRGGGGGGGGVLERAERVAEDAESGHAEADRIILPDPKCKGCRSRAATVVLLPCRHLCVCRNCEKVVKICPICLASSDSRVEVNLS